MVSFRKSVEIGAPIHMVFAQWERVEEFPRFLPGVLTVERPDENHFHWCSTIMGHMLEWDGEITARVCNKRLAWRSTSGTAHSGTVTFEALPGGGTWTTVEVSYEPEGLLGQLGARLGLVESRVEGHLCRFRDYMEERVELNRIQG